MDYSSELPFSVEIFTNIQLPIKGKWCVDILECGHIGVTAPNELNVLRITTTVSYQCPSTTPEREGTLYYEISQEQIA